VVVSTVAKAIDIAKFLKQKVNPTREGSKVLACFIIYIYIYIYILGFII
jgi:hypothetical protein